MYLIPLLATLMSCVFSGALPMVSRNLGHRGVAVFSLLSLTIAFISSALIWIDLYIGSAPVWLDLFGPWFEVGTVTVSWIFYYDLLTAHMLFTVTSVSLAVHIYAVVYMRSDPHLSLFMSYLSLFTFFMLVYVCGDNLLVMLVGWEGQQTPGLSGIYKFFSRFYYLVINPGCTSVYVCGDNISNLDPSLATLLILKLTTRGSTVKLFKFGLKVLPALDAPDHSLLKACGLKQKNTFYTSHIPAYHRIGPHTKLFNEILVGFLLGDGWLEKHGEGARLGISLIEKFKDVAEWYKKTLFLLGYVALDTLPDKPLVRTNRPTAKPYYQIRSFTFHSLLPFYNAWYVKGVKVLPLDIEKYLTPLSLAIWVMGDGSGMVDGGFRLASHSFTKEENLLLCDLLGKIFGLKATIQNEGSKGQTYIRIWKRSSASLKTIISPYLKESCLYKFRHVKQ